MTEHDFDARYRSAMAELAASDIPVAQHLPPLHRLLRRLGVKLRPPHYQTPSVNMAVFGVPFAVLFGLLVWLVPGLMGGAPAAVTMPLVALSGGIFGWLMARNSRRDAQKAGLSSWDALTPDSTTG